MTRITQMTFRTVAVAIALAAGLLADEKGIVLQGNSLATSADARVGRPLTPMSYAGVARRTTRRAAVAVGTAVAVGAAAGAAAAATTTCVQAVDPYGRVYTRCY